MPTQGTLVCAISGELADVPVVSPASGEVFEKRLIVKYIQENGTDPVSGKELSIDQLVDIKFDQSTRSLHRPLATASLPALLKMLQDEWDACMLSNFTLQHELKTAREELTHALYQNDAACRVINRLSSELTSARQIIATLPHGRRIEENDNVTDVEMVQEVQQPQPEAFPGVSEELVKFFTEKSNMFSSARKSRGKALPEGLASPEAIKEYRELSCHDALHSTSVPGITCMDMQKNLILTGGMDKNLVLFNTETETIEGIFKGHVKKISAVILHPNKDSIISSSFDTQIRIWKKGEANARKVIGIHDRAVTDISLHPTGEYFLSTSDDAYWSLVDLHAERPIIKVKSGEEDVGICCSQFHPDGLIFGTGSKDSAVKIWDLKEQVNVAKFPGHQGVVRAIAFSENGYYLATGSEDGEVKIWDLRKLKNLKTFPIGDEKIPINRLSFDQSGAYLAIASNDIKILQVKTWAKIGSFDTHTQIVSGVCFGEDANFIASCSWDKTLRIYGTA